ncbi:hypothetical protein ARMSODRAFT_1010223 [Armillaria solidipes]|uniref:PX domain-containing protein n=1 Tax=Armillaria solidipes TaxID=1076256 RepID=A0A2H3ATM3_9AGAR|nr:hypothetical protein ARMSODRAFT_1010223 [Armillaria solidipes]
MDESKRWKLTVVQRSAHGFQALHDHLKLSVPGKNAIRAANNEPKDVLHSDKQVPKIAPPDDARGRDELVKGYARHAVLDFLDELLGDGAKEEGCGAALGEHWPPGEECAVIGLVGSCREMEKDRLTRAEERGHQDSPPGFGGCDQVVSAGSPPATRNPSALENLSCLSIKSCQASLALPISRNGVIFPNLIPESSSRNFNMRCLATPFDLHVSSMADCSASSRGELLWSISYSLPSPALTTPSALGSRKRISVHDSDFPGHNAQSRMLHFGDTAKASEYPSPETEEMVLQGPVLSLLPLSPKP